MRPNRKQERACRRALIRILQHFPRLTPYALLLVQQKYHWHIRRTVIFYQLNRRSP